VILGNQINAKHEIEKLSAQRSRVVIYINGSMN